MNNGPAAEDILASPEASFWLIAALRGALARDPVDAAADAAWLAKVLGARADALLALARGQASEAHSLSVTLPDKPRELPKACA